MSPGNTTLIDYGIQNENSHIRAHVCPVVKRIYVFPTANGVAAMESGDYPERSASQPGYDGVTAKGYLVPPFNIGDCVSVSVNDNVWAALRFDNGEKLTEKGDKAVRLVVGMLKRGLFPFPVVAEEIRDEDLQIKGADILVKAGVIAKEGTVIQVKCDFKGGEKSLGGTGNLFLQTAECNPLRRY